MSFDYKKIIKSRELRSKILRALSFIPDEIMIKLQYRIKTGNKLDLKNPKRFTEKLQWYKLNYKNPLMIKCADKYDVRDYIKKQGFGSILIPCYGVYNCVDDVDWDSLPNQFVMKDTLGGGGNSVVIVKDKKVADLIYLKSVARKWTKINSFKKDGGREWPYYSGKKHRIIFEKYIDSKESEGGLIDYKFFCFNGHASYMYVIADRHLGSGVGLGVYDAEFNRLDVEREDEKPLKREINKPANFDEMRNISEKLSEGFPHVRVDLYDVENNILFSELTFFDGSGYMKFSPDNFDYELGSLFKIT